MNLNPNPIPSSKITRFGYVIKKSDLSEEQLKEIKSELTVKPYRPGNYGKFAKNTSFKLYVENSTYIGIPKYFGIERMGRPLLNKLEQYPYPLQDMSYVGELRPAQQIIIEKVIRGLDTVKGGLLIAGCGIGKTNMAIYLACKYKLKTLFIVHKEFLMRQFINRVIAFTNVKDVGIIQQKKVEVDYPFVVGMVQSLARKDYPDELFKDFGMIIIDECHHMGAKNFSQVFQKMTAKHMLGITAEEKRPDGLFKIINWYMGPFLHIEPQKSNSMVLVKKFLYKTSNEKRIKVVINKYTKEPDRSTMITNLCYIKKRNIFIRKIVEELYDHNKKILCLTGRIKQVDLLYGALNANPLLVNNVGKYIGKMSEAKLQRSATKQIIIGTYDMAQEGLDIPDLQVVLLLTPKSAVKQSVGRILRKDTYDYHPLVIDIEDDNPIFAKQSARRSNYFSSLKYTVQEFQISDYELESHHMYDDSEYIRECLLSVPDLMEQVELDKKMESINSSTSKINGKDISFSSSDSDTE